jgi:hypothetical protein
MNRLDRVASGGRMRGLVAGLHPRIVPVGGIRATVCEKRQGECGLRDEAYRARTVYDSARNEFTIEGRKLAAMGNGEHQEIGVRHLGRVQQSRRINTVAVHKAYIIGPELEPGKGD